MHLTLRSKHVFIKLYKHLDLLVLPLGNLGFLKSLCWYIIEQLFDHQGLFGHLVVLLLSSLVHSIQSISQIRLVQNVQLEVLSEFFDGSVISLCDETAIASEELGQSEVDRF